MFAGSPGWPLPCFLAWCLESRSCGRQVHVPARARRCVLNPCRGLQAVGGWCQGWWRGPLAGVAASCAAEAAQASEAVAEATGGDGHSLGAEDVAHGSRCGGSDGGVLGEGGEDGSWEGDDHGGRLDDDAGVLALPDTGLVAAVSQRGGSAGAAGVVAGHVCGVEGPWKRGC